MIAESFRFNPPARDLPKTIESALVLAFGPVNGALGLPEEGPNGGLLESAESTAVAALIASRWPRGLIEDLFGTETAAGLAHAMKSAVVAQLQAELVAEDIAEVAAGLDVPILLLKGAAMLLAGAVEPGSRSLCDVDVLAPSGRGQELQDALKADGCFEPPDLPHGEHQLQVLGHPGGMAIEVHLCIRGVRGPGGGSLTLEEAIELGLVEAVERFPGRCLVPSRELMLAHLVVHGLVQHGLDPTGYPVVRVLADAIDLGLADDVESGRIDGWFHLIEQDASRREVLALAGLARSLVDGVRVGEIWQGSSDESLMLRHLVLGATDLDYCASMRMRALMSSRGASGSRLKTTMRIARNTLFPTRGQIDKLYGKPRSRLGYLGYRLYRPFDLVGRAVRYSRAAWRARR